MTAHGPADLELVLGPHEIEAHVDRLADQISRDHPDGLTLVGVLKGCTLFFADLARRLSVPTRLELVAVAPYDGSAGRTRVVKDLDRPVAGERVVLVSTIVDTGLTADFLLRHLRAGDPASVALCALVDKRARRILPVSVDYHAVVAPDAFLIGYGLDYAGRYRNVAGLWGADAGALAEDPDLHVSTLYPRGSARHDGR
jgi:hypoxanthine phosphoribosyltransferase